MRSAFAADVVVGPAVIMVVVVAIEVVVVIGGICAAAAAAGGDDGGGDCGAHNLQLCTIPCGRLVTKNLWRWISVWQCFGERKVGWSSQGDRQQGNPTRRGFYDSMMSFVFPKLACLFTKN